MFAKLLSSFIRFALLLIVYIIAICAFVLVWGFYTQALIYILKVAGITVDVLDFGKLSLIALVSFGFAVITSIFARRQTKRLMLKNSRQML